MGGFRLEFRVILNGHKPWVVFEFHDFDQFAIRTRTSKPHPMRCKLFAVHVIEFIAMAMAFFDFRFSVQIRTVRSRLKNRRLRTQSHGAAHFNDVLLFVQEAYHWVRRIFVEFSGVGVRQTDHISTVFDDGTLHP